MLKLNLDKFLILKGGHNSWGFLRKNGFSHWMAHRFQNDKTRNISFADMERLCILFKCTPNDLLEWIPDKQGDNHPNHPLQQLKAGSDNVENILGGLNYQQLKELAKAIKEQKSTS